MSLRVSDEVLIDNLLERHNLKDLFTLLAKEMKKDQVSEAIISLFDKCEFDIDEMVGICLDTKKGQDNSDEVTLDFIDEIFDSVWDKRRNDFESNIQFENKCYPGLWELRERIEYHYLEDVLGTYDNDVLINYLEDTREFDDYIDDIKDEVKREIEEEYEEELEEISSPFNTLEDKSPDDLWIYLCNQAGCGYYDKARLTEWMSRMFRYKLNKSSYAQMTDANLGIEDNSVKKIKTIADVA